MGSLPDVVMHSAKGWTHPYQVKRFVGVLEAQQHVLQDGQRSLSHDGVQQLGEDLVGRKKKANEKAGWYHDMSEKDPAGKGGTEHLPHLQSHLLSRRHPQSTLKIPSGLESLIQACAVPGTLRCRALGDPNSHNIPPDLLIDEAT